MNERLSIVRDGATPNRDEAQEYIAELKASVVKVREERDAWEETAKRHCRNEFYWRQRALAAEAQMVAIETDDKHPVYKKAC